MLEPRRRIDERALEKEEEDYFNEDRYKYFFFLVKQIPFLELHKHFALEIDN